MPIELVTVERVSSTPTAKPSCTRFLVTGVTLSLPSLTVQYYTVNQWAASLCQRAQTTGQPLQVTWKDGRYGRDLVMVEFAQ